MKKIFPLFFSFFVLSFFSSCLRFTFTGASIPAEAKTASVAYFDNNAALVNPNLSRVLTEKLQDRITGQTRLVLTNSNADLNFDGEIESYNFQPVAIQGNETAQLTQLTIGINVKYINRFDESKSFESRFSRFQQFPASQSISAVEDGLIDAICADLVDDIFNKALVNW